MKRLEKVAHRFTPMYDPIGPKWVQNDIFLGGETFFFGGNFFYTNTNRTHTGVNEQSWEGIFFLCFFFIYGVFF